jgi:hypothetical protein
LSGLLRKPQLQATGVRKMGLWVSPES